MKEKPKEQDQVKKQEKTFGGLTLSEWSAVTAIIVNIIKGLSLFL